MNKHRPILLDEILETLQGAKIDGFGNFIEKETAKQQLLAEVLDMIGEDEKIFKEDSIQSTNFKEGANYIKKALRKAAKERFQ